MISVCIATFNGATYIEEQLCSILNQLSSDDEVIISDDGSTDRTIEIINKLKDRRIRIIKGAGNLGVVKNFERALENAKGDYIFLSDQDDIWLPNKVEILKSKLLNNLLVVSDCMVVNAKLDVIQPSFFKIRHSRPGLINNIFKNSYLGCCMAFKKELLSYALPIPKTAPMHDMWLGLIAQIIGIVAFVPDKLILYRRHGSNLSPTSEKSHLTLYRKLIYRLVLLALLINRYFKLRFKKLIR